MSRPICSVEGCERTAFARTLCGTHLRRQQRHGDVRADQPIGAYSRGPEPKPKRIKTQFRKGLPQQFYADADLTGPLSMFGAVIVCERCGDTLGPVWNLASAAMATHAHLLRAHDHYGVKYA